MTLNSNTNLLISSPEFLALITHDATTVKPLLSGPLLSGRSRLDFPIGEFHFILPLLNGHLA